jgi:DNA-binding transcriptional regulator LsrR (DeoR family)
MASKELLLRVARMSHESLMTNEDIAEELFKDGILTSRNTKRVRELIDEAVIWLLTQHEFSEAAESEKKELRLLESNLCDKYDLLDARVVAEGETHGIAEYAALVRRHGRAAAKYFDEVSSRAEDNGEQLNVAISGGQTILDMVSHLAERRRPNVHFYGTALVGRGSLNWTVHIGPETNSSVAWARSGRIPKHLFYGTVPPYDFSPEDLKGIPKRELHNWVREEIGKQVAATAMTRPIKTILQDTSRNINMAIAGLGIVCPSETDTDYGIGHLERMTMMNLLKPLGIDPHILNEEGACGEMSYCLFDRKGLGNPRWKFFVTAGEGTPHSGVDFFRHLVDQGRKVMVIAGAKKWDALQPAINARLLNVLITDAYTANRLLKA